MSYSTPVRRILTGDDLKLWLVSPTHNDLLDFITDLAAAVKGKPTDYDCGPISPMIQGLLNLLSHIDTIITHHPVQDTATTRFGKPEFRDVYDEITCTSQQLLLSTIPGLEPDQALEISTYLNESFGNRTRIDYGSGHELNFVAFLLCLYKLGLIKKEDDFTPLILKVFTKYMSTMRTLQREYWLEPAGSHGVWGLDDYHFLPFLFGASQLATHLHLRPKSIHNKDLVDMFWRKYMYFECIHFINEVKTTATLRWHSPMLDDISAVKTWSKLSEGMIKMFKAEVLAKLPIVQHFLFGNILPAPEGCSPIPDENDSNGNHHHHHHQQHGSEEGVHAQTWGDCCGIKIPSAVAASQMNKVKPLPFD
jgi:serine/threonine-protein phosphatase 2A activator